MYQRVLKVVLHLDVRWYFLSHLSMSLVCLISWHRLYAFKYCIFFLFSAVWPVLKEVLHLDLHFQFKYLVLAYIFLFVCTNLISFRGIPPRIHGFHSYTWLTSLSCVHIYNTQYNMQVTFAIYVIRILRYLLIAHYEANAFINRRFILFFYLLDDADCSGNHRSRLETSRKHAVRYLQITQLYWWSMLFSGNYKQPRRIVYFRTGFKRVELSVIGRERGDVGG